MRCGKAAGSSGVVAEMLQASGEVGISSMTDLFNGILAEYKIPEILWLAQTKLAEFILDFKRGFSHFCFIKR